MNGLERVITRSSCGLVRGPGTITAAVGRTDKYSQFASVRMVGVKIEIRIERCNRPGSVVQISD